MNTFSIATLGCKVNQCDSAQIRQFLISSGLKEVSSGNPPDLYIVNTCCVTSSADSKSRSAIRSAARKTPKPFLAVTGCYVKYDKDLISGIDGVDLVFESGQKEKFYDSLGINVKNDTDRNPGVDFGSKTRAFLKVQEGCNNKCTYCIVPYVRGESKSRPIKDVARAARSLVDAGHKEIVLTGICLGAYGRDGNKKERLSDLIKAVDKIEGLERIRLSSIEARDIDDSLLEVFSVCKKLCRHIHIPFQSGDDNILKKMNRKVDSNFYLEVVDKAKKKVKDLAVSCDIIIGFPGETENNFKNSVKLIGVIEPVKTHIFTFSRRRGLLNNSSDIEIGSIVKKERYRIMRNTAEEASLKFKKKFIGKTLSVLFEQKKDGLWTGYSDNYIKVVSRRPDLSNNVVLNLKVKKLDKGNLIV